MTDYRGYDSQGANGQRTAEFANSVDTINRELSHGIPSMGTLKDIASLAPHVESENFAAAKVPLRKTYLISVPWSEQAQYIRTSLTDVSFSTSEQAVLANEDEKQKERQAAIDSEIAAGAFPWLAHAKHNTKNFTNPYVIGFYQMPDGKIKPLYGPKYFSSKRQISDSILIGGFRSETKVVSLLRGVYQKVDNPDILKTEYWDLLPEDLRMHLEDGELVVTTEEDIYHLTPQEINTIAQSQDLPSMVTTVLDTKIAQATEKNNTYHLLFYGSSDEGRTGVLMNNEDGEMNPVVVTVAGKEFIVEMKGCGTRKGGFGDYQWRTGRHIISGAVEKEQADTEFNRLQDNTNNDSPKAAGRITFTRNGNEQGYIIRLTPSTVRASYTYNECYPKIDDPEYVERILHMYTSLLADNLFGGQPKIMDRSSHTENILLWGNENYAFTDYSDHALLADPHYPHLSQLGYVTPDYMLKLYINMAKEIPGFSPDTHLQQYYNDLATSFANHGVSLNIDTTDSFDQVAERIWERCLAYQVFRARRQEKYIAEGLIEQDLLHGYRFDHFKKTLGRETQTQFAERYRERTTEAINAAKAITVALPSNLNGARFIQWVKHIEEGDVMTAITSMDGVYKALEEIFPHLSPEQVSAVDNAYHYFFSLKESIVTPIQGYFAHELDIVTTAQESCPEDEREILEEAKEELVKKQVELAGVINADPASLFTKITNRDELKKLFSLGYYGH